MRNGFVQQIIETNAMSARDVDLEFEEAYHRLFSTSAPPPGADRSSSAGSEPRAEASKAPHTVEDGSRSGSAKASTSRVDAPRQPHSFDAGIFARPRQSSVGKSRSQERFVQAQQVQRERSSHSRSFQSHLDALARHRTASSFKGKSRAQTHVEAEVRHVKSARRSPATPAPALPQSNSMPYPGSVAYYPYPTAQPSYQVSAPLIAPGSGMTSMPGQAVAWTQPIISTGPMPAIGYPGFSASVTFSQPQFFASPPQAVHPSAAVAAPTSDAWLQQQMPQPSGLRAAGTPAEICEQQQQQQSSASKGTAGPSAERDDPLRRWKVERAEPVGSKADVRQDLQDASKLDGPGFKAKQKQVQQRQQGPWKPRLNQKDLHIPKKRGRPPRIRDASPPDVKPRVAAAEPPAIRIKSEAAEAQPFKAVPTRPVFDGSLPLASDRGPPYDRETHTLFIHLSRRLRWFAHLAVTQAEHRALGGDASAMPSASDASQWARWSNSVAARLQNLRNDAVSTGDQAFARRPLSQSDPAGLFPRDKRHDYVALRKSQHSAKRTASSRICIPRLLRYVAKTAAAAEGIEARRGKRAFLEERHRAAKLAKHMLKLAKPTALDVRRMWSVWARAAHARGCGRVDGGAQVSGGEMGRRRVSFAPPQQQSRSADVGARDAVRVKQEPESGSAARTLLSLPAPQVKQEPDSDVVLTALLAASPVCAAEAADAVQHALPGVTRSPLFLRRNFRVYRMLGLPHLPLS